MTQSTNRPGYGIALIIAGMTAISINDMLIKSLSAGYPLHQTVFVRSVVGLGFSLLYLQFEGGFAALRTPRIGLQLMRGLLIAVSNICFFAAIAVLPLAETTALFFVAPLFVTLLSIPLLGEKVGIFRLSAVAVGFLGVIVMQRPGAGAELDAPRWVLLLPVVAALTYALFNIMARKLGRDAPPSVMAVYVQITLIAVSAVFWAVAGDGRFAEGATNESMVFLLRPWVWPEGSDWWAFLALGAMSAIVGYALSAAYRAADAATIAPFEYVGLPLAVFWGITVFGTWPAPATWVGIALIAGAGLVVFLRERHVGRGAKPRRVARRF